MKASSVPAVTHYPHEIQLHALFVAVPLNAWVVNSTSASIETTHPTSQVSPKTEADATSKCPLLL